MNHRRARARRAHNCFRFAGFKQLDEVLGNPARFEAVTGIKCRLTAAGLPIVEFYFATSTAQHLEGADANGAPHLIDDAGDEEPDFQRVTTPLMYPG